MRVGFFCWGGGGQRTSKRSALRPDRLEGCVHGPQRRPQRRLDRQLEEVAKAVGGGYCQLQMPLKLAFAVMGTSAGHILGALKAGLPRPPIPMHCWVCGLWWDKTRSAGPATTGRQCGPTPRGGGGGGLAAETSRAGLPMPTTPGGWQCAPPLEYLWEHPFHRR